MPFNGCPPAVVSTTRNHPTGCKNSNPAAAATARRHRRLICFPNWIGSWEMRRGMLIRQRGRRSFLEGRAQEGGRRRRRRDLPLNHPTAAQARLLAQNLLRTRPHQGRRPLFVLHRAPPRVLHRHRHLPLDGRLTIRPGRAPGPTGPRPLAQDRH